MIVQPQIAATPVSAKTWVNGVSLTYLVSVFDRRNSRFSGKARAKTRPIDEVFDAVKTCPFAVFWQRPLPNGHFQLEGA